MRRLAIDVDPPGGNQLFHFPPRTDAALGQRLVQALRLARDVLVPAPVRRLDGRTRCRPTTQPFARR